MRVGVLWPYGKCCALSGLLLLLPLLILLLILLFFETGFLCVALAVLELTL
jgi:hypothetical protein